MNNVLSIAAAYTSFKCIAWLMLVCHAHFETKTVKVATAAQALKCLLEWHIQCKLNNNLVFS